MTTRCGKEGQEVSERLFEGQSWVKRQTLHTPVSLAPCLASRKYNRFIVEGQKGRTCRPITITMLQPWTLTSERLVLIMEVEVRHIWHALSVQLTAWCFSFQAKRGRKEGRKEGRKGRQNDGRKAKKREKGSSHKGTEWYRRNLCKLDEKQRITLFSLLMQVGVSQLQQNFFLP